MSEYFQEPSVEEFELTVHNLIDDGNEVIRVTPFHYIVNTHLHVYPRSKTYYFKKTKKKGEYKDIHNLINKAKKWELT